MWPSIARAKATDQYGLSTAASATFTASAHSEVPADSDCDAAAHQHKLLHCLAQSDTGGAASVAPPPPRNHYRSMRVDPTARDDRFLQFANALACVAPRGRRCCTPLRAASYPVGRLRGAIGGQSTASRPAVGRRARDARPRRARSVGASDRPRRAAPRAQSELARAAAVAGQARAAGARTLPAQRAQLVETQSLRGGPPPAGATQTASPPHRRLPNAVAGHLCLAAGAACAWARMGLRARRRASGRPGRIGARRPRGLLALIKEAARGGGGGRVRSAAAASAAQTPPLAGDSAPRTSRGGGRADKVHRWPGGATTCWTSSACRSTCPPRLNWRELEPVATAFFV